MRNTTKKRKRLSTLQSSKHDRSTGSNSDSCDDSLYQLHKQSKHIGKQLLNLAYTLPFHCDDDDDDATQDPNLDNPNKPDKDVDLISCFRHMILWIIP